MTGHARSIETSLAQHVGNTTSRKSLKRKLRTSLEVHRPPELAYPSPPMSRPPSPWRSAPPETPANPAPGPSVTTRELSTVTVAPGATPTLPFAAAGQQRPSSAQPFTTSSRLSPFPPSVLAPTTQTEYTPFAVAATTPSSGPVYEPASAGPSSSRGGRRSKSHVASACINCKRAHLSCDVQRPCARCVASGKQDSCVDVQHKKRGRPRMREEGEFKVEQMPSLQSTPASAFAGPVQQSARPIAATRQRRGESFRSLRSVASDDSTSYAESTPGYGTMQSPFTSYQPPTPRGALAPYEVATALLDPDLVIIRANKPFESILSRGFDIRGRHISDFAAPADNESFQAIRNHLRGEREARDPAYMPPIQPRHHDPVQNIPEAEAERFTDGYHDRTYRWTHARPGPVRETFPARVRLAKASTYFVVVTLPSFQPTEQRIATMSGPLMVGPPLQPRAERFLPERPTMPQSAPPTMYAPAPRSMTPPRLLAPAFVPSSQTYPPHQPPPPPPPPYQPPSFVGRLPVAEPPTGTNPFTPRSIPREALRQELQLPPIVESPAAAGTPRTEPSEDEGEARAKRRRMGIDEVLQR